MEFTDSALLLGIVAIRITVINVIRKGHSRSQIAGSCLVKLTVVAVESSHSRFGSVSPSISPRSPPTPRFGLPPMF